MPKLHELTEELIINCLLSEHYNDHLHGATDKIVRAYLSQKLEEIWTYVRDNNVLTKENLAKILGVETKKICWSARNEIDFDLDHNSTSGDLRSSIGYANDRTSEGRPT